MDTRTYNEAGVLIHSVTYNTATSEVTVFNGTTTVTVPADPAIIAAIIADAVVDARRQRLATASATLRQWAANANATTVTTNAQNITVMNTVLDRLAVFFDRFADLLDER